MDELNCKVLLNSEEKKIIVSGLESVLEIDISSDVDFTVLVEELTKKIDKEKTIILNVEDQENIIDPKNKLIIETLKKIFESYNESLKDIEVVSDDNNIENEEIAF